MNREVSAKTVTFSEQMLRQVEEVCRRYPTRMAALLPVLSLAQEEHGWLSGEVLDAVADLLEVPRAHVRSVASFYLFFRTAPVGRHLVMLCDNLTCMLHGAESLLEYLSRKLGIPEGGTTPDGRFTLIPMECIGGCDTPPAMLVDKDFYGNLTPEKVDEILEKYR
jgi:NADH-quinone oxidoreductase E subunit